MWDLFLIRLFILVYLWYVIVLQSQKMERKFIFRLLKWDINEIFECKIFF